MTSDQIDTVGPFIVGALALVLWVCETGSPLSEVAVKGRRLPHLARNITVFAAAAAFNFGFGFMLGTLNAAVHSAGIGLMSWLHVPLWLDVVLAVLVLDAADYFRHRLHHRVPLLWRLHRTHHRDEAVDVSTAFLNHPFEPLPVALYFAPLLVLFGFNPLGYALKLLLALLALTFHHSNLRLPRPIDGALAWLTPTPRTHRVHHARHLPLTDSNFGTILTVWDRLFGTWRTLPAVERLDTGLEAEPARSPVEMMKL